MMACCNYTYQSYIEPSGEVDVEAYNEAVKKVHGEHALLIKEGEKLPPLICRCECHTKGMKVLH